MLGPPGVGKSLLARHVARRWAELEPQSAIHAIDLAQARDAERMLERCAEALGVPLHELDAPDAVAAHIASALASRGPALLVLDNLEHLAEHAALWPGALHRLGSEVAIVVASREPLRLDGEQRVHLGPLAHEDARALIVAQAGDLGIVLQPDAPLDQLVEQLDRLPLALKLAASRLHVLSPAQLLGYLDRRLDLLRRPEDQGRGSSLEAAVALSWESLDEVDKRLLAQCSVFRGGFTLEALEDVLALDLAQLLDGLDRLIHKSLLYGAHGRGAARRYDMLHYVRDYALRRLEPEAREGLQAAHRDHYAERIDGLWQRLGHAGLQAELATLRDDVDNILAALAASEPGRACGELAAAAFVLSADWTLSRRASLLRTWHACARLVDDAWMAACASWQWAFVSISAARNDELEQALAQLAEDARHGDTPEETRRIEATSAMVRAFADYIEGRYSASIEGAGRATASTAHSEHASIWVSSKLIEALALESVGRREEALEVFDATLARDHLVTTELRLNVRAAYAATLSGAGRYAEAEQVLLDTLASAELVPQLMGSIYQSMARVVEALGRSDDALAWSERAIALYDQQHRTLEARYARAHLAGSLLTGGDFDRALEVCNQGLRAMPGQGALNPINEAWLRGLRGICFALQEAPAKAHHELAQAIEGFGDAEQFPWSVRPIWGWYAVGLAHQGLDDQADAALARLGRDVPEAVAAFEGLIALTRAARGQGDRETLLERARAAATEAKRNQQQGWATSWLVRKLESLDPSVPDMEVGPEVRWIRLADGSHHDLSRRGPTRRLLAALVDAKIARPGEALDVHALVEAGWPGERVSHEAGLRRVYTAINVLRKLGLHELLHTGPSGYLLAPESLVQYAAEPVS